MVVIKRLTIALMALFVLVILVIAIGIYGGNPILKESQNTTDAALKIALNDPDLMQFVRSNDQYVPIIMRSGPINSTANKGFIRYPGNLTGVAVDVRRQTAPNPPYHFYFIVDTYGNRTVDKISWTDLPGDDEFTIPPGAAWYDRLVYNAEWDGKSIPYLDFEAHYSPENARVDQLIVNREGLDVLRSASAQMPLQDLNVSKYSYDFNDLFNGTAPNGTGWKVKVDVGFEMTSNGTQTRQDVTFVPDPDEYYLVLINGETSRAVNVSVWPRFFSLSYA